MEKSYKVTSKVHSDNAYEHDGKKVTIAGHALGRDTYISEDDLAHLNNNVVFNLHKKNGFITVTEVVPEEEEEMLVGSSTQPSTFALADGTALQLGDVVGKAFTDSGLTIAKWNAQKDATREKKIQAVVDTLDLKKD